MIAIKASASDVKKGNILNVIYTPAATIVAACISALTGVGPSIASGSQICSGNCADFPIAPIKTNKPAQVSKPIFISKAPSETAFAIPWI